MAVPKPNATEAPLVGVLLALEHSLLFGVQSARGVAATHSAAASLLEVLDDSVAAHRTQRDDLNDLLDRWHVSAPVAAGAYVLPEASRDALGALTMAIALEERAAATYLDAIGKTKDAGTRALCLTAMSQAAVRAARLRLASGTAADHVSTTFPGR